MAGQLKINGVTLATEDSSVITLENPQIKDSSNNLVLDQSGSKAVLNNVEVVNDSSMMFRNKIINGDMRIDQRNAGSIYTSLYNSTYILDRWYFDANSLDQIYLDISRYSMTASDFNSTGFSNALKVEVATAESAIAANEYGSIQQRIEAQTLTDLKFGTSNAKPLMLSFWVKTSLTGTYGITLQKMDTTARLINKSYTTTSTDWQHVKIPIAGDTDSGALIANDNGEGFRLIFWLGVGSDYTTSSSSTWINYSDSYWGGSHQQNAFLTTQNATFHLTGVQLEVGNQATPFEHKPIGVELELCQRYFEKSYNLEVAPGSSTETGSFRTLAPRTLSSSLDFMYSVQYKVPKRASGLTRIYSTDGSLASVRDVSGGTNTTLRRSSGGESNLMVGFDIQDTRFYAFQWTADAEF